MGCRECRPNSDLFRNLARGARKVFEGEDPESIPIASHLRGCEPCRTEFNELVTTFRAEPTLLTKKKKVRGSYDPRKALFDGIFGKDAVKAR